MTSALATKERKSFKEMSEAELLKHLKEKAKVVNLQDTGLRSPMLKINYTPNLPGIPFGGWVYNQTFDGKGNVIEPGIHVNNPTIAILAVRYQYFYRTEDDTQKPLFSLPFKAFDDTAKQYKAQLGNKVLNQTSDPDQVSNIKTNHIVYARVKTNEEWLPCMIHFKGSNYMEFSSFLKTFKDYPYYTFPTYLPNPKEKKESGKKVYYVVEGITHDEKIFDIDLLDNFDKESEALNDALDSGPGAAVVMATEESQGEDIGDLPPPNNYLPPTNNQYNNIPAKKIEAITEQAAESGLADMDDFKEFVKEKTGLTTLQGLSDENYIKLKNALKEYKAQQNETEDITAFPDINEDEIPF